MDRESLRSRSRSPQSNGDSCSAAESEVPWSELSEYEWAAIRLADFEEAAVEDKKKRKLRSKQNFETGLKTGLCLSKLISQQDFETSLKIFANQKMPQNMFLRQVSKRVFAHQNNSQNRILRQVSKQVCVYQN